MTSWLRRTQAGTQSAPTTPATASAPGFIAPSARILDPNAPDARLDVESRCIYERRLPGNAYITAHVTRLQDGFYDSPSTHGDCINNVRFLAVSFVFHPSETINRFQSATVTIALHDDTDAAFTDPTPGHKPFQEPINKPKFLRFAPHVLFGGVSPETLDWNFNLTGSLGVAQTPVSASLSPSGGVKSSYKLYQMMRIQGSTRTLLARHHYEYDIEDGEVCWTMEENSLQKSGLPREMTFVMLITKGDIENVVFDIKIQPKVASWFGHYPGWWNNVLKYRPLQKEHMDLDRELGQKFAPTVPGRGFNFANLAGTFNDFVSLPGTTFSLTDHAFANQVAVADEQTAQNVAGKTSKPPTRQNTQQAQSDQANRATQPPTRPQTVPPPMAEAEESETPMDYHIYLHNPRTINLHATPPPHLALSPDPTPGRHQTQQPINIIRPHSTAPNPPQSQLQAPHQNRTSSPANTKLKRRSIDITNLLNSNHQVHYDTLQTPQRNTSGEHTTTITSSGSLRRRHSKPDLRSSPPTQRENLSRGNANNNNNNSSSSSSDTASTSSRISPQPPPRHSNITTKTDNPSSPSKSKSRSRSRSASSPKSIIIEAPSPPDPGLSGFKANLQAHIATQKERERDRDRDRTIPVTRSYSHHSNTLTPTRLLDYSPNPNQSSHPARLPFEVQPNSHRPPREQTPSPEPTDNPDSDTTTSDILGQNLPEILMPSETQPSQTLHQVGDGGTSTPGRRERMVVTRIGEVSGTHSPIHVPISVNGTVRSPPSVSQSQSQPQPRPPPASLSHFPSSPPLPNSTSHASPSKHINPLSRPRRDSTASPSPPLSPEGVDVAQPSWGDLKEEARRRARKRLSMPVGGFGRGDTGMGDVRRNDRGGMIGGGRGYEYITEADGEWDER